MYMPIYSHYLNLYYILPALLAEYSKNLAEYSRILQEHHTHAYLFPPSITALKRATCYIATA